MKNVNGHPDVIVVGAGFSGAVMAERFATVAQKRVLVIEQRHHIGGNCYDYKNEDGILIHKYGPHLFHTNKRKVWEYLSEFTAWHHYEHKVLSSVDGQLVPLPFNLNTLDMLYNQDEAQQIETLLISNYGEGNKVPILELRNSSEPMLRDLGALVYDKFFVNYTVKQWGCKPEEISPEVTARVPVVISRDDRYFHDEFQAIPKGGYTKMFDKMLFHPNISIELGCNANSRVKLDLLSKDIFFDNTKFYGQVVYTGRVDDLLKYFHGELPYRSLEFQYEKHNMAYFQPTTTVNYPNEEAFTRITEFKHILPVDTENTVIVKEYPQQFDKENSKRNIPYYPILNEENRASHSAYLKTIEDFENLFPLGRLADYKYYNMDDAVDNALSLFENIYKS